MALLHVGPLPVPSPGEVVDAGRTALGWGGEVVALGASLPSRVDTLVVEVERLVGVLGRLADRVDSLVDRADAMIETARGITEGATEVVELSRTITAGATEVIDLSRNITTGADEVIERSRGITDGAGEVIELSRGITTGANDVIELSKGVATRSGELLDTAGATSRSAQEMLELYQPMLERGAPLAQRFVDDLTQEEIDAAIKLVDQLPELTAHMVSDIMPILETLDRVGPDLHELLDVTKDLRQGIAGIPGLSFLVKRGAGKEE